MAELEKVAGLKGWVDQHATAGAAWLEYFGKTG
jgi:hypothetical protein